MADSPKATETAQALFCAVVDKRGEKFPVNKTGEPIPYSYKDFKTKAIEKELKEVFNTAKLDAPGVMFRDVDTLLKEDNSWYHSSVHIANKIYDTIKKFAGPKIAKAIKSKGLDLFYTRGDRDVMNSITTIFKSAKNKAEKRNNDSTRVGIKPILPNDLNKWSPADIYFATEYAKQNLREMASTSETKHLSKPIKLGKSLIITGVASFGQFEIFNAYIKYLIDQGELLPLSLKKTGASQSTVVKSLNYDEGDVEKYFKQKDVGFKKFIFTENPVKFFSAFDTKILVSDRHKLQFRDKGSSGESKGKGPSFSFQCVIVGGSEALDGSFGGDSLPNIMRSTPGCVEIAKKFTLSEQQKLASTGLSLGIEMTRTPKRQNTFNGKWYAKHRNNPQVIEYLKYAKSLGKQTLNNDADKGKHFEDMFNSREMQKLIVNKKARRIGQFLYSKMLGGRLITILSALPKPTRDLLVINMLRYAGSRSELSAPHLKAGDISSF